MNGAGKLWQLALDRPGSADRRVVRRVTGVAAMVLVVAVVVVALGQVQLPAFPQFSLLHAGFVFLVDAVASFMLFGQFRYQRKLSYALLAGAYLFSALIAVPFLLAFPDALGKGPLLGGAQSAIWIWHFWHILFPALMIPALLAHQRPWDGPLPERQLARILVRVPLAAVALVASIVLLATAGHDRLPILIGSGPEPLAGAFYGVGGLAAGITGLAAAMAWRLGWRRRTVLHLWLAVSLTVSLAEVAASLGAHARYTVGWYFGRLESMIAASVLMLLFLGEINRLYRQLAAAVRDLSQANEGLVRLVEQKEALVGQLRQSEEQVRQLAFYDPLTELPNRRLLLDRMGRALSQARRHRQSMAIMFLDLDHFKQINDTLGHDAGDELLRQVAARLAACVRAEDSVCRSGGDEFIVVLAEVAAPRDAARVADKMLKALGQPVALGAESVQVSASIGIALYPVDGSDDVQALMKKADMAMYAAKEAGRNQFRFYGDAFPPAADPE